MDATMDKTTEAGASRDLGHASVLVKLPGLAAGRRTQFRRPGRQIAVMHRILVEEKNWISESRFCMR
jgi:chromate transporter